jgi:hypothetical protein
MTSLNSRQRKMLYGILIFILLGPIVYLGFPEDQRGIVSQRSNSWVTPLARLRRDYDLGEATLGEVDPSSSAMNLVLLGLRGPAASLMHLNAIEFQERKQWAKLRSTVDSIILLQPHYVQIWKFQGWNLAYNVSREWDKVDDRYYWVKEGIKFVSKGTRRNESIPILAHNVGEVVQQKMGVSDEKKFFRAFFREDPDERFSVNGQAGPDPEINAEAKDSYLVAYDWFSRAKVRDENDGVPNGILGKGMTYVFFRGSASKALLNFAEAMTDEGNSFDDHISNWSRGLKEWTEVYGRERFLGLNDKVYQLYMGTGDEVSQQLKTLAEENGITVREQQDVWDRNVKMVNYDHWRGLANLEQQAETRDMHKTFAAAKRAYLEGRSLNRQKADGTLEPSEAQVMVEDAMAKWLDVRSKNPAMFEVGSFLEEGMLMVQYWLAIHQLNETNPQLDHPMRQIWEANPTLHNQTATEFYSETRSMNLK